VSPLRRRRPFREPLPVWLLLCEGKVTERDYFDALRRTRALRAQVRIEHCPGGLPQMVEEARRRLLKSNAPDRIWCVGDVDDFTLEKIRLAIERSAMVPEISLAISNPCFELWALLHFEDCQRFLTKEQAKKTLRKHLPTYEKFLPFERLAPHFAQASERARALAARAGSEGQHNPSTGVHQLVESLLPI